MISARGKAIWAPATAAVLGLIGLGFRIWLSANGTPPTNSDEATMGLAALHISQGREFPVFFYGQHYMGTIEAYLAAPLVKLFGPTLTALRVPTLVCYALFLALMFVLTRRLFSPGLAVLTVGLLAFGSDRIVKNQLIAGGGYPESAPMVAGLLLLTYALLARRPVRWYAFAGWGVLFGLIAWNHWLAAPYLLGALVALLAGRVLTRRTAPMLTGGFLLGVLPLLIGNISAGIEHNSVAVFFGLNGAGSDAALWDRIVGGAWGGLPLGMGLCQPSRCSGWSLWWAPVFLVLLLIGATIGVRGLSRRTAVDEHAVQMLGTVLAVAGLLSVLSYVRSPAAADTPIESARYLSLLAISLPAALWPLWRVVRSRTIWALPATLPIIALATTMFTATVALADAVPGYREMRHNQAALIAALDGAGIRYVHSEYWTCNWITYLSDERVICGVITDQLAPGFNRYPPYWRPQAQAVVAPIGSPLDAELAHRMPEVAPLRVTSYHIYPS